MPTSTSESVQTLISESMKYTIDSILDYIKRDNTSYAVLLNGKWGSGKTYFWENVLKEEIKKIEKKTIYVSLYGINSTEEINKRIALGRWEIVQKLNESKWGGRMTELAKATFGILKSVEIPFVKEIQSTEINFEQFIDYTNTVLCFDDLERANINVNEILGYINNFVEHDGIKVIIGNEEEIAERLNEQNLELKMLTTYFYLEKTEEGKLNNIQPSKEEQIPINNLITNKLRDLFHKKNEYNRIKEKLIGKTLTIQLEEGPLIQDIINDTKEAKLQSFLEHNIDIIETTFKESGTKNIRILKQGLEDFELIYRHFEEYDYESNVMLQSILKFVMAASFAIKTNMPSNEKQEEIISHKDFVMSLGLSGGQGTGFLGEFHKKYYIGRVRAYKRRFFKFADVLIRKGIFNKELFKEEMDDFQSELNGTKHMDPHEEFIRGGFWYFTDDDEFWEIENAIYNRLINGEFNFVWYFNAYTVYKFFSSKNIITKDILDIKSELLNGLKKTGYKEGYIENIESFVHIEEGEIDENLVEFRDEIIKINNKLKIEKEQENVTELVKLMQINPYSFYLRVKESYASVPFFVYCNVDELYKSIIKLSALDIKDIIWLIEKRITLVNGNSDLLKELPNLLELKCKLIDVINSPKVTLRLVLLKELIVKIEEFENKANRLNGTSQSTLYQQIHQILILFVIQMHPYNRQFYFVRQY
ncbi:P-loop NTPase fold protein [Bacillus cereus]|uniref:P-loop NTPase fold protein n=1 Tax=Bacillus cereus TaxID=1396 RepID=UPI0027E06E3B|nr:P-loop NTPase fold protein [Bacillus cereus]